MKLGDKVIRAQINESFHKYVKFTQQVPFKFKMIRGKM